MSITLSQLASMSIGGVVTESNANAALVYMEIGFPNIVKLFFNYGNTAAQVFSAGSSLPKIIVTMDLKTGKWSSSSGLAGTLIPASLLLLQTATLNLRNGLENFAVNNAIVAGAAVPWTAGIFT